MFDLPALTNRRILVIDDNPAIHEDFRKIFAPAATDDLDAAEAALFGDAPPAAKGDTFTLDSAHQGEEGLALVQSAVAAGRPYAMAFVDVRMPPGWDGIETIARIWEVYPDLQVVICTAYSDYSWDDMIAKLGVSDRLVILKKPFDNIEVLQLAHALTAKWHLLQQAGRQIEDLEALVNARTVELNKSTVLLRTLVENLRDYAIFMLDVDGLVITWNAAAQALKGYRSTEIIGTHFSKFHTPEDVAAGLSARALRTATEEGRFENVGWRVRQDGTRFWAEVILTALRNEQGDLCGFGKVTRDLTERKAAEDAREEIELQLRHAQKMESIGQLAAGIAHEINTPTQYIGDNTHFVQDAFRDISVLLAVQGRLLAAAKQGPVPPELIAEVETAAATADVEYLAEEVPKAIEQCLQGVQRVSKIVGAMKEFSHPGTNEKMSINLNQAIESTVTVASNEWKYVAQVVTDFDESLPLVSCLPGEFNQVVLNIVVNASHAIADVVGDGAAGKGTITLRTRQDEDWVELRISDTGAGIPENIRAKIFDPFFTTKGVGKGTGQGLAIAHSVVVDKHGGEIRLESEVGKGTTFIIRLPLQSSVPEALAA